MKKEYTCIICPNGCDISVEVAENGDILDISGHTCKRGEEYVRQELTRPMRTIATSVLVEGGELPLVSVRLDKAIPRELIFPAMEEIKKVKVKSPTIIGDVILSGVAGTDANVIITKEVGKKE